MGTVAKTSKVFQNGQAFRSMGPRNSIDAIFMYNLQRYPYIFDHLLEEAR